MYFQVVRNLVETGYKSMERIASPSASDGTLAPVNDAHLALYKYCDKYLRLVEDSGKARFFL